MGNREDFVFLSKRYMYFLRADRALFTSVSSLFLSCDGSLVASVRDSLRSMLYFTFTLKKYLIFFIVLSLLSPSVILFYISAKSF